MKQAQIAQWGDPDSFNFVDAPIPQAQPGWLVVKNRAAGLNPVDWKTRAGAGIAGMVHSEDPVVLGWDLTGEIIATGPETSGFNVGDIVFGMPAFPELGRCYAQYVQVKVTDVVHAPEEVDMTVLGAVPLAGLTAYQGLFDVGGIHPEQKVLVQGGAGGVGHLAIQLARHAGTEVWATTSSRNMGFVEELGAHPIDYTSVNFDQFAGKFDLVLDTVGGDVFQQSLPLLTQTGRIVTCPDPTQIDEARQRGIDAHWVFVHPDRNRLEHIAQMLHDKTLTVHIQQVFPFEDLPAAHRLGETGHVRGKLALVF